MKILEIERVDNTCLCRARLIISVIAVFNGLSMFLILADTSEKSTEMSVNVNFLKLENKNSEIIQKFCKR